MSATVTLTTDIKDTTLINITPRLLAMIPAACMATLLLLYVMHRLIYVEHVEITEEPLIKVQPFVMEVPPPIENRIKPLEKPIEPPVEPTKQPTDIAPLELTQNSTLVMPNYQVKTNIGPAVGLNQNGTLMRTVTAPPQYPSGPLARGIEGYVDVVFDVTTYGGTNNIRVFNSQPQNVFDKAAVKAVKRWKYKPRYVEGVATAAYNIKERIRFSIEK